MRKSLSMMIVSLMMAMIILVSAATPAFAADYTCSTYESCTANGGEIYEVIENNRPLRAAAHDEGKVLARLPKGSLLRVTEIERTKRFTLWATVPYVDDNGKQKKAYIYTGNIEKHSHDYETVLKNQDGGIKMCKDCGYAVAQFGGRKAECDLMCVSDQIVKGEYSEYDSNFWGVVGQLIVSFVPYAGEACDLRDLIYYMEHDPSGWELKASAAALLPVVFNVKHLAKLENLRHLDEIADTAITVSHLSDGSLEHVFLHLKKYGRLPDNYITKDQAKALGWKSGKLLDKVAPNHAIGGDIYKNISDPRLPEAPGRVYYEADLNSIGKLRKDATERLVYSNDGLYYYTSDHYDSFTLIYEE